MIVLVWIGTNGGEDDFVQAYANLYALDSDHPNVVAAQGNAELIAQNVRRISLPDEDRTNHQKLLVASVWALQNTAHRSLCLPLCPCCAGNEKTID